jgi:hypothetical protein
MRWVYLAIAIAFFCITPQVFQTKILFLPRKKNCISTKAGEIGCQWMLLNPNPVDSHASFKN